MPQKSRIIMTVIIVLTLAAALFYIYYRSSQDTTPAAATDALGQEIIDRWGAGLPEGYSELHVSTITDGTGYLAARLTYESSVSDILAKWEAPTEELTQDFNKIADALSADPTLTEADREQLQQIRPGSVDSSWLSYRLTEETGDSMLILLYDTDNHLLYLAEQQV